MKIKDIKIKMENYIDFYGGDLLEVDMISKAKTKKDLERIIENHRSHMEAMLSDANSHLDNLKKIGIGY
jgi:uncharacterized protein YjbI with pentapeptide repeats